MASGIDTVIFDMDGVIFDSEILVLQAWKEVAERHGIAGVEAACHECLGTNSVVSKGVFLFVPNSGSLSTAWSLYKNFRCEEAHP